MTKILLSHGIENQVVLSVIRSRLLEERVFSKYEQQQLSECNAYMCINCRELIPITETKCLICDIDQKGRYPSLENFDLVKGI